MWAVEISDLRASRVKVVSAALFGAGAVGVQEDWMPGTAPPPRQPWDTGPPAPLPPTRRLIAWFDDERRDVVDEALAAWTGGNVTVHWRIEPERDWEAESRAAFPPIDVGDIRISPPWAAGPDDLIIDPGSGFGTGDHPTTRQALLLYQALDRTPTTALDVGCGSGILALAAARDGWTVHGTDIDDAALANARRNAELNGLTARFDRTTPDALEPADLVFANLHAELLVGFAADLQRLTRGDLLLAGILEDRRAAVEAAFTLPLVEARVDGPWVALHYRR
jgi:ribosomal protein L11 methyltransferase